MNTESVSADSIIARSERIAQRMFEERMLVITVNDSKLHRFNEVGTYIWELLETPRTIKDLCDSVAEHFDGGKKEDITKDVMRFIDTIERKGLVRMK